MFIRFWALTGHSEFILRFFSVIFSWLAVVLVYQFGTILKGEKSGLLAAFLLAVSPINIWYAQEARMYALVLFLALLSQFLLWQAIQQRNGRFWVGYIISTMLMLLTHYLTVFLIVAQYTFFSLGYRQYKRQFLYWTAATAVSGIPFALWVIAIFKTGGFANAPISWIPPAHWYEPVLTWLTFTAGTTIDPKNPIYWLPAIGFLIGTSTLYWPKKQSLQQTANISAAVKLLTSWLFIPIILIWLISLNWPIPNHRALYVDRYLLFTTPALCLLTAIGWQFIYTNGKKHFFWLNLIIITAVAIVSLWQWYTNPAYQKENWRQAVTFIENNWREGDAILVPIGSKLPLSYYGTQPLTELLLPAPQIANQSENNQVIAAQIENLPQNTKRIWLLVGFTNVNPHGFVQTRNMMAKNAGRYHDYKQWLDTHYPILAEWQPTGVSLTLYANQP